MSLGYDRSIGLHDVPTEQRRVASVPHFYFGGASGHMLMPSRRLEMTSHCPRQRIACMGMCINNV